MQNTDPSVIEPTRLLVALTAIDRFLTMTCDDFESPIIQDMVTNKSLELLFSPSCLVQKMLYTSTIYIPTEHCKVNVTRSTEISKSIGIIV